MELKKTENIYSRGKIYKIISSNTTDIYVGSSCEPYLSNRLASHLSNYRRYLIGKYHYNTSFKILEKGNYKIILLEDFPCERKDQLEARERWYIENTKNCINKRIEGRTGKEYYNDNHEKILENAKIYYEKNKDKKKQYRELNKEKICQRIKLNGEIQVTCIECNITMRKDSISKHRKTAKHIKALEQNNKV